MGDFLRSLYLENKKAQDRVITDFYFYITKLQNLQKIAYMSRLKFTNIDWI
jgi:hypothetical protein